LYPDTIPASDGSGVDVILIEVLGFIGPVSIIQKFVLRHGCRAVNLVLNKSWQSQCSPSWCHSTATSLSIPWTGLASFLSIERLNSIWHLVPIIGIRYTTELIVCHFVSVWAIINLM
jgi:hypothetical protein